MLRRLVTRAVSVSQRLSARAAGAGALAQTGPLPLAGPDAGTLYGVAALLVPAFFFFYGLDAFPLRDNNEGLYAEVAREMLATGNWLVPHLDGVPYLEKPPLLYWLMALSMALLGHTPAAARLVSGGAMLLLCAALFQFCRLHGSTRAGSYASVGLASALPVALVSHVVLFDPLLTALMGGCLLCYLHGYLARSRRAHLLAALLLALAVLEKGAVALVLAGGIVALFLAAMRDRDGLRRALDPAALGIVLAVAGPWHLAAALRQDGFAWFYFINEHVLRFLGRRMPDDYHHGPSWFYLPRLPLMLLPWTPFLLLLPRPAPGARDGPIARFCQAAVLFPLVFFSLSQAKADYYLMVALPALALLLAVELVPRLQVGGDRRLALCWGMAAACAAVLLALAPGAAAIRWRPLPALLSVLGWGALALVGARFFARLRSLRARELALLCVALACAPALALLLSAASERGARDTSRYLACIVQEQPRKVHALFIYRDFEDTFASLPFYLGQPVPVIDSTSRDLQYGCRLAPGRACVPAAGFLRAAAAGPVGVVVQRTRAAGFLALAGPGWRAEWVGDKMVFFNR